jgi:hypothetical protein
MTGTDKNLFSELGKAAQYFSVSETSGVSGITEKDFSIDSIRS